MDGIRAMEPISASMGEFNNVKWGQNITELEWLIRKLEKNDLPHMQAMFGFSETDYTDNNPEQNMGDIGVEKVVYSFRENELFMVQVTVYPGFPETHDEIQ